MSTDLPRSTLEKLDKPIPDIGHLGPCITRIPLSLHHDICKDDKCAAPRPMGGIRGVDILETLSPA